MRWFYPMCMLAVVGSSIGADDPPAQAVLAWAPTPSEVHIVFDGPLAPAAAEGLVGRTVPYFPSFMLTASGREIPMGKKLGELRIVGSRLVDEGRTLILTTDRHPGQAYYNLLSALGANLGRQLRHYTLAGLEASWDDGREGSQPQWSGWLPSLRFDQNLSWAKRSVAHRSLEELLAKPGRLTLKGRCDIPPGRIIAIIQGTGPFHATVNGKTAADVPGLGRVRRAELAFQADGNPVEIVVTATTGPENRGISPSKKPGEIPSLSLSFGWKPEGSEKPRDLHFPEILQPWVPATLAPATALP
jgi:hypothetical protein